ncbi:MAG: leucyl/phenylalanyl-tRNA--protein transferase [Verrucomicrobia bacterium]|nr:leucyl/phenylalanyl-tRNA--protein transferase [Verrucomicrobiota bacterium]
MRKPVGSVAFLSPGDRLPDPSQAREDGLVAVGGDLAVERLLEAYQSGLFPWSADPITWWSPDPRGVLPVGAVHVSRSLARTLRRAPYTVTFDQDFSAVIRACATVPRGGASSTWISPQLLEAYEQLAQAGHAHSVECWQEGLLVGGVYGVSVGGFFAGESMFHRADDASKVALVHLDRHLFSRGFTLLDCQMVTSVTRSLGAMEIPRADYLDRLARAVGQPSRW